MLRSALGRSFTWSHSKIGFESLTLSKWLRVGKSLKLILLSKYNVNCHKYLYSSSNGDHVIFAPEAEAFIQELKPMGVATVGSDRYSHPLPLMLVSVWSQQVDCAERAARETGNASNCKCCTKCGRVCQDTSCDA